MKRNLRAALAAGILFTGAALAIQWSPPVDVQYDEKRCVSYRAAWNGDLLMVQAVLEPGWHTFAIDNKERQREKLAGKPSLGIERPTEIGVSDGLAIAGPWLQSPPKDFSKPEIRWFSWGFERQAIFAVKARRAGAGPARIAVRGQACSDAICKNIDVSISLPIAAAKPGELSGHLSEVDPKSLIPVR